MSDMEQSALRTLLDQEQPTVERVLAARRLGDSSSDASLSSLLQIARSDSEPEWVAFSAGESIAEILVRRAAVSTAPLHDFSGPAYLGFDEAVARSQRRAADPLVWQERDQEGKQPA